MLRVVAVAIGVSILGCNCASPGSQARAQARAGRLNMAPIDVVGDPGPGHVIEVEDIDADGLKPARRMFDQRVRAGDRDLWFRLDSYGGNVLDGNDFIQHVGDAKKAHGLQVHCVVDTKAYSMAFVFLQSFCDERLMTKRSTLLAHSGKTASKGTVEELESDAQFLAALNTAMATVCAERMGMPLAEYRAKTSGSRDWTMAYDDALAAHAVDGVIRPEDVPAPYELEAPAVDPLRLLLGGSK